MKIRKIRTDQDIKTLYPVRNLHEELKHKRGYSEFLICIMESVTFGADEYTLERVSAREVDIYTGTDYRFFARKVSGEWQISEYETGLLVSKELTLKKAVENATSRIGEYRVRSSFHYLVNDTVEMLGGFVNEVEGYVKPILAQRPMVKILIG